MSNIRIYSVIKKTLIKRVSDIKKSLRELSLEEICFLIFFISISLGQAIGIGAKTNIINIIVSLISIPFFAIKMYMSQLERKEKIFYALLLIYGVIASLISQDILFLVNIAVVLSALHCRLKKCLEIIFWFRLACMLAIIGLTIIGIRDNNLYFVQHGAVVTDRVRNSLGYYHPNVLVYHAFVLFALFIYIYWNNIKWYHFVGITFLEAILFFLTWSKTGFICTSFMLILLGIIKYIPNIKWIFTQKILTPLISIIIVAPILAVLFYSYIGSFISPINNILQGRFSLAYKYFQHNGLNIFGRNIPESFKIKGELIVIDSSYVRILFEYGIIGIILFLVAAIMIGRYLLEKQNSVLLIIYISFCLYAISERGAVDFLMAFPYIYLSKLLFKGDGRKLHDT